MARWLKVSLVIISVFVGLIILIWVGGAFYISANKASILKSVIAKANQSLSGKITVASMTPTLLDDFPSISLSLKQVVLSDSLIEQHHHDVINAGDIGVSLGLFSLIRGKVTINKITLNNAKIYLYTDSNGYSNTNVFKKKPVNASTSNSKSPEIKHIDFNNVNFVIENQQHHKLFNFAVNKLQGKLNYPDTGVNGTLKIDTKINSLAFNTKKGSFVQGKDVKGNIVFNYSKAKGLLTVEPKVLTIGGDDFKIGAKISVAEKTPSFAINITADQVLFKHLANLLSPNITKKLLKFDIKKPIAVKGDIVDDGSGKYRDPLIKVAITVRNNILTFPSGKVTDCNFDGYFTNKDTTAGIIGDENSVIKLLAFRANYFNAPLKIDTFLVTNLTKPIATGLVTSKFPLTNLNNSLGTNDFEFKNGDADLFLYCRADIDSLKFTKPVVSGKINISNADITYVPRKLHLVNSALNLNFNQNNLSITNGRLQLGKSVLNLNCTIDNFLKLYYNDPDKILVKLNINSPQLYLNEFLPLLGPRTARKSASKGKSKNSVSKQLSNVLEVSQMDLHLKVDKAIYQHFAATNLDADIALRGLGIYFNRITVNHAGGKLAVKGNLIQNSTYNDFKLNSTISHVNVKDFFYSFDNFGQKTITNKNLKGYLSALANITGKISHSGKILPKSIYGSVVFNLTNAALVDFAPIADVAQFAFPGRNLSNIELKNLDGTFLLKGNTVEIKPMQINSSVLNVNLKGIYGYTSGTNIQMDVPLRNPKKDKGLSKGEKKENRMRGIVLHLKAIDEDGKVKVKWNKDHD
ncbi:hypothetical protein ABIB40_001584 [Pedobacter sp. UYP30]|uniref:AsmA family protein n=1 Tax=Pedobacter sp. UYP30 TaxID=1756400 RepID=UPI0033920638